MIMYKLICCLSVRKRKSTDFLQNPTLTNGETNLSQYTANRASSKKHTVMVKILMAISSKSHLKGLFKMYTLKGNPTLQVCKRQYFGRNSLTNFFGSYKKVNPNKED